MSKAKLAIIVSLFVSGCGSHQASKPDSTARLITARANEQGEATVVDVANGTVIPVPSDLPTWAPAFPGAKVVQVIVQGDRGTSVKSVVFATSEDMKTIVTFYNAKIAAAGMTPIMAQDTPEGAVRMVETSPGTRDTLMIGRSDGSTSVTMSYTANH